MTQDSLESASEVPVPLTAEQLLYALRRWRDLTYVEPTLARLFIVQRQARLSRQGLHHAINTILEQALAQLAQSNLELSELLTLRFLDKQTVAQTMRHINVAEAKLHNMQHEAIVYLIAILLNWEVNALAEQQILLLARLEALTNSELIGIEEHLAHLLERLRPPTSPWIIAIEGLGGIGKTTLANAMVRRAIEARIFDEVGWVTARQQRLNVGGLIVSPPKPAFTAETLIEALAKQLLPPQLYRAQSSHEQLLAALHRQLNEVPHLLVIDNLETVLDLDVLLPTVQELANPTKFLLTTREALFDVPDVYHFRVPELSEDAALALIRREIEISNLVALAACTDEELQAIVGVVGGNPLALRLVVGQAHIHDLDQILVRLRSAQLETEQGDPVENLYTYIYHHAWQSLTEIERDVLLIMPLVHPDGDELANIAEIGGKSVETIRQTLNRLVTLNLIDVHGAANQRRYRIHGLTRTFLDENISKW